jgi:hypothetical protein
MYKFLNYRAITSLLGRQLDGKSCTIYAIFYREKMGVEIKSLFITATYGPSQSLNVLYIA